MVTKLTDNLTNVEAEQLEPLHRAESTVQSCTPRGKSAATLDQVTRDGHHPSWRTPRCDMSARAPEHHLDGLLPASLGEITIRHKTIKRKSGIVPLVEKEHQNMAEEDPALGFHGAGRPQPRWGPARSLETASTGRNFCTFSNFLFFDFARAQIVNSVTCLIRQLGVAIHSKTEQQGNV